MSKMYDDKSILISFGHNEKDFPHSLRMSKNKTQKQLAEYAGITTRYYQYLETGRKKPTIQIALKLAEALDATAEEVFTIEL